MIVNNNNKITNSHGSTNRGDFSSTKANAKGRVKKKEEWFPIEFFCTLTYTSLTHFLTKNDQLTSFKCRYCSIKIDNHPDIDDLNNHLFVEHRLKSDSNYYVSNPNHILIDEFRIISSKYLFKQLDVPVPYNLDNKSFELSFDATVAILIATQNLPIDILKNSAFRSVFNKIPTTYNLSISDIKNSLIHLSSSIRRLIRNSFSNKIPFTFSYSDFNQEQVQRSSQLCNQISQILNQLLSVPLYSLTTHIWDSNYMVFTLQFYDCVSHSIKFVPLTIRHCRNLQNTFEDILSLFPGLEKSIISITSSSSPSSPLVKLNSSYLNNILSRDQCVFSTLIKAMPYLFGHEEYTNPNKNINEMHSIQQLVNLINVNIESSIFGKINGFYRDLKMDEAQMKRFLTFCPSAENRNIDFFDKFEPSEAHTFLFNFMDYREAVKSMDPFLRLEKFTETDFTLINRLGHFLQALNRTLEYITSSNPSISSHVLLILKTLEFDFHDMMNLAKFTRYRTSFLNFLEALTELRKQFAANPINKLSSFLCPAALFDDFFLLSVFGTKSLPEISDLITDIAIEMFQNLINSNDLKENSMRDEKQKNQKKDGNALFEGLPFAEFGKNVKTSISFGRSYTTNLDSLLRHELKLAISHYIETIQASYSSVRLYYANTFGYENNNGAWTRVEESEVLSSIDCLLDIELKISDLFLSKYRTQNKNLIFLDLIRIINTMVPTSIRPEHIFLENYKPAIQGEILEDILFVRLFDSQFRIDRMVHGNYDLNTICQSTI